MTTGDRIHFVGSPLWALLLSAVACGARSELFYVEADGSQSTGGLGGSGGTAGLGGTAGHGGAAVWQSISAGWKHTCAIEPSGSALCWGGNEYGQSNAPSGRFFEVCAGWTHSCGIRIDGSLTCWGQVDMGNVPSTIEDRFQAVSCGSNTVCALRKNGSLACAGYAKTKSPEGRYEAVSVGLSGGCVLGFDGHPTCWTTPAGTFPAPPPGSFRAVSCGAAFNNGLIGENCGIRRDDSLSCWGIDVTPKPQGRFLQVSTGPYFGCALEADQRIACWGMDAQGETSPPVGHYVSVDVGSGHACGITVDGEPVCWGSNANGQLAPL